VKQKRWPARETASCRASAGWGGLGNRKNARQAGAEGKLGVERSKHVALRAVGVQTSKVSSYQARASSGSATASRKNELRPLVCWFY
jgi:hypothetical protein